MRSVVVFVTILLLCVKSKKELATPFLGKRSTELPYMVKDTLFQNHTMGRFVFDHRVAAVFPDMVQRSVPGYHTVMELAGDILGDCLEVNDAVFDLGCSVGTTLFFLTGRLSHLDLSFVGVDSSAAMIDRARKKKEEDPLQHACIDFVQQDILDFDFSRAGAVLLNYTMQFVEPGKRKIFLRRLRRSLRPGGVVIVSEKVCSEDPVLDELFKRRHESFKRARGYSDLEISRKRDALDTVLVSLTVDANVTLLEQAGFAGIEIFFKWCNFVSFVARAA